MTEKRFTTQGISLYDKEKYYTERCIGNFRSSFECQQVCDLLNEQEERINQLESQLYCTCDGGVCGICDNEYLEPVKSSPYGYYISKCKKGHSECSKSNLKYCEDFKLKK